MPLEEIIKRGSWSDVDDHESLWRNLASKMLAQAGRNDSEVVRLNS